MQTAKLSTESIITSVKEEASILKISYKKKPKPSEENWQDLIETYKISHTKRYEMPPVCLQFIGKDGTVSNMASLGNFSAIIGKAKSRKTFSICLYLAAAIKKDCTKDFIRATLPSNKQKIILIDTEQSEYDVSRVSHRILSLSEETNPSNFDVYSFRSLPPEDRMFMIEQLIYSTEDLGILVIDGIRDLIKDINSPDEATKISSKLLKWTQERHIHIITVIHQNKGDNNARGHVGTEIINKSETVISVEKDNEISIVRPEFIRGKDFPPFAFGVDEKGLPYIIDDWSGNNNFKKKLITANAIPDETHYKYLKEIFTTEERKKYIELQEDLKVKFQSFDIHLSKPQLVEFMAYYRMKKMVNDTGGKGRAGNQYSLNNQFPLNKATG